MVFLKVGNYKKKNKNFFLYPFKSDFQIHLAGQVLLRITILARRPPFVDCWCGPFDEMNSMSSSRMVYSWTQNWNRAAKVSSDVE